LGCSPAYPSQRTTRPVDRSLLCVPSRSGVLCFVFVSSTEQHQDRHRVDGLLKPESLVPTINTFSSRLSQFNFDFFVMIVVDLLHEFELGVWKSLLTHLVRILHACGPHAVLEFNKRFRDVAPFGRSTIWRFARNVADMSKLAARDFEDILQCCIPCFDGLFPAPHNDTILELLYVMAYWHSLAKLRMHTDSSLKLLELATTLLGQRIRFFAEDTSKHFRTIETDKEYRARMRATQRRCEKAAGTVSSNPGPALSDAATSVASMGSKQPRSFSLQTSKLHALGDYVRQIRQFGTTDSFSTQAGELQHRVVKGWNDRTNQNNAVPQIVKIDVREAVHNRMSNAILAAETEGDSQDVTGINYIDTDLQQHHHIGEDESGSKIWLGDWLHQRREDPAYHDFLPKLKAHLLAQLRGIPMAGDEIEFTRNELNEINIQFGHIFPHATARFHYTSYDVHREQDTINVNGQRRYIMLRSNKDTADGELAYPYWYAKVLGIYHANVFYKNERKPHRMEFLWVRWFGCDPKWTSGASALRLDRIGFIPAGNTAEFGPAFGFVDPQHILRACHIIPAYSQGRTTKLLGRSGARDLPDGDWLNYYVMRFVDRDMMMRYTGLGVGHMNEAGFPTERGKLPVVGEEGDIPIAISQDGLVEEEGVSEHGYLHEDRDTEGEDEDGEGYMADLYEY
ncbi:hypothetical protein BV22DRAFT_1185026, partial [Leucogyrophana mollusca]